MAEKVTSMRLNDEDLEQFKAFAKENGFNQQQAFNSLIALAELEKAKDVLGDRSKEIDSFRDTVNKLLSFYINSLEVNTTTEQTIREELQRELSAKDTSITALYDQVQELKADNKVLKDDYKNIESINTELQEQLQKANSDNVDKQKTINKLNSNNDLLQENLQEYKQYKEQHNELEKELEQLKEAIVALNGDKTALENAVTEYQGKLKNTESINKFYIDNISELKKDIDTYKAEIKSLEQQHKQDIQEIKEEYKNRSEKDLKAIQEQLESKYAVELSKKDLEIEKLKFTEHKPSAKNTKTKQQ